MIYIMKNQFVFDLESSITIINMKNIPKLDNITRPNGVNQISIKPLAGSVS